MMVKMMAKRLYLEIAKSKGTPAEALNLRKRQSRAVDCSAVRGEPVEQVRERVRARVQHGSIEKSEGTRAKRVVCVTCLRA